MGALTVVLREAVQNSWDAKVGDHIRFALDYYRPSPEQRKCLLEQVISEQPENARIHEKVTADDFAVLVFSDRGTSGLNGPVTANTPTEEPNQRRNFVDFMFEIGRDAAKGIAGGTYGFGKSSFFLLSRVSTVCVHTRCLHNGKYEERLMAAHLGTSVAGRTTGRVWWGRAGRDFPEPLIGKDAGELAERLGFRPFVGDELGTSIMVFAPRLTIDGDNRPAEEQATTKDVIGSLRTSIIQWFWPKMKPAKDGRPPITFSITHGGNEISIPAIDDYAPYGFYSEALSAIEDFRASGTKPPAGEIVVIESQSPKAVLGYLCLLRRPKKPRNQVPGDFEEESARELADQSHHVALLREPRLVVKYLAGPNPPSEGVDVAGVFIVDERSAGGQVENAFALSEPPVHDDWVPAALENRTHKVYVNGALRRIRERVGEFVQPFTDNPSGEAAQPGLGAFSEMMGGLLVKTTGTSARVQAPSGGSGGGGGGANQSAAKVNVAAGRLERNPEFGLVLAVPFTVEAPPEISELRIAAHAVVLLDGGTEREPPPGADSAEIKAFVHRTPDGTVTDRREGPSATIPRSASPGSWYALAGIPDDARVRVTIAVQET